MMGSEQMMCSSILCDDGFIDLVRQFIDRQFIASSSRRVHRWIALRGASKENLNGTFL
jgi:hypothetical protein